MGVTCSMPLIHEICVDIIVRKPRLLDMQRHTEQGSIEKEFKEMLNAGFR